MREVRGSILLLVLVCAPKWAEAANLCLAPSITYGENVTIDCTVPEPTAYENVWFGYETSDSALCESEPLRPDETCLYSDSCYQWGISSSPSDPTIRRGPIVDGQLYLWLECSGEHVPMQCPGSLSAATLSLTGTLEVVKFTPLNGFLHLGPLPELLLAVGGCPSMPIVVGMITVQDPSPVDGTSWGEAKAAYR